MKRKIAIFGGKFDPPGVHHVFVANSVLHFCDGVVVIPSGPRQDRPELVSHVDKTRMMSLTFLPIPGAHVDCFDLLEEQFTPAWFLPEKLAYKNTELWFVVGSDLIQGGGSREAKIQKWMNGEGVWNTFRFVVIERSGFPFKEDDVPPSSKVLYVNSRGSSTEIRKRIRQGKSIHGLVVPEVEKYIKKRGLYLL